MSDLKEMIRQANEVAVNKMKNAQPYWVDIKPAHEVLGIDKYTLLHAGPPIAWEEMCGPMRGAIVAVLKYEGLAENDEEALALAGSGKIKYEPCHHHNAVGPMTGVTSYSMPMICVLNKENGNYAYSTINEGTGKGIRFGSCGQDTVDQLVRSERKDRAGFEKRGEGYRQAGGRVGFIHEGVYSGLCVLFLLLPVRVAGTD